MGLHALCILGSMRWRHRPEEGTPNESPSMYPVKDNTTVKFCPMSTEPLVRDHSGPLRSYLPCLRSYTGMQDPEAKRSTSNHYYRNNAGLLETTFDRLCQKSATSSPPRDGHSEYPAHPPAVPDTDLGLSPQSRGSPQSHRDGTLGKLFPTL